MDGLGLNITVMSYNGSLDIGIVADRDAMPDVGAMTDWLAEELEALEVTRVFPTANRTWRSDPGGGARAHRSRPVLRNPRRPRGNVCS